MCRWYIDHLPEPRSSAYERLQLAQKTGTILKHNDGGKLIIAGLTEVQVKAWLSNTRKRKHARILANVEQIRQELGSRAKRSEKKEPPVRSSKTSVLKSKKRTAASKLKANKKDPVKIRPKKVGRAEAAALRLLAQEAAYTETEEKVDKEGMPRSDSLDVLLFLNFSTDGNEENEMMAERDEWQGGGHKRHRDEVSDSDSEWIAGFFDS